MEVVKGTRNQLILTRGTTFLFNTIKRETKPSRGVWFCKAYKLSVRYGGDRNLRHDA